MNKIFSLYNNHNKILDENTSEIFSDTSIKFLSDFSKKILIDKEAKKYPDLITFAFFCRKANLEGLKLKFKKFNETRIGRGIVFHIAPSNVPLNFAYSLLAGILAGNINIVRLPSKNYNQNIIFVKILKELSKIKSYHNFLNKILLVQYDYNSKFTEYFSSVCDIRVIWGGDETINNVRKSPLQPKAYDITFPDRYSICLINADKYVKEKDKKRIANDFFNDTFLFDQNACTSPHIILWNGINKNINLSKKLFWSELHKLVQTNYEFQNISSIDKLTAFYNQSVNLIDIKKTKTNDNLIWLTELKKLKPNIENFRSNCGYFLEHNLKSINDISKISNNKYQTLAYFGYEIDELQKIFYESSFRGLDRIVKIGQTSQFSLIWDGYNLINSLSILREFK